MHVTALILAAGKGARLRSKVPKPLLRVNSRPLLEYSLLAFDRHPAVRDIVVTVNPGNEARIRSCVGRRRFAKEVHIVGGGRRRQDSVYNGLRALPEQCDIVLIHDSARPCVSAGVISAVIRGVKGSGACICGVPVKGTIKRVVGHRSKVISGMYVEETLKRDELWEIQTPQGFAKGLILKAYERYGAGDVTDDASLVEKAGGRVRVVKGSYANIKVTTPEDIAIAEALIKRNKHLVLFK